MTATTPFSVTQAESGLMVVTGFPGGKTEAVPVVAWIVGLTVSAGAVTSSTLTPKCIDGSTHSAAGTIVYDQKTNNWYATDGSSSGYGLDTLEAKFAASGAAS